MPIGNPTTMIAGITDVTATAAELNILDGATLSTAELNVLDGITATYSELNILSGVTAINSELNLLDLDSFESLAAGQLLVATGANAATWKSTGVKLSAPDISGIVTAASALTLPAFTCGGDIIGQATYDLGSAASPFAEAYIGNTSDYLKVAIVSNIPTIYGVGAYTRFGDAATTSQSLASEDDVMVTGKLEVDGASYLDGAVTIGGILTVASDVKADVFFGRLIRENTTNMAAMYFNINITGTDSTNHEIKLGIDNNYIFSVFATGDGAGGVTDLKAILYEDLHVASAKKIIGDGTGANGIVLKNLKNAAASALSGTQLDVEIDVGGAAYHFTVYPTKA